MTERFKMLTLIERLFREKRRKTSTYHSTEFDFAMLCPTSWEVIYKDKVEGEWKMPIGWGSRPTAEGRAALLVNVRKHTSSNRDGNVGEVPKSPEEYLATAKATFPFRDLRIEVEELTELAGMEAARLVYSYRGTRSRIREMTVTAFGPADIFQLVCEAPETKFAEHQDLFEFCIASFALGAEPAVGLPLAEAVVKAKRTAIVTYNQGVGQFDTGQFDVAERTFNRAYNAGDASEGLKMAAAHARGLCLARLGRPAEIPETLRSRMDEAGCTFLAYSAAAQLVNDGHRAAISSRDLYHVEALIGAERFRLQFTSLFGQSIFNAWRVEKGRNVSLLDLKETPDASSGVRYVDGVLKRLRNGPSRPVRIPESGFPEHL